jgi:N-acetylmuramoyl-L-alanine amidase
MQFSKTKTTVAVHTVFFVLFFAIVAPAQSTLLDRARNAFTSAQQLEKDLNAKSRENRTDADYIKVINAFQRVYLITPHTGYADNALISMARLYEEIEDTKGAIRTWKFLLHEYPETRFADDAEKANARLSEISVTPTAQVAEIAAETGDKSARPRNGIATIDGIRYWEAPNSVRVVVDVTGELSFKKGEAKSPDRVFIDINRSRLGPGLLNKQWPVKSGLLEQIRVGQYDNSTVRVVLDVGNVGNVSAFTLSDPDRIIIDVVGGQMTDNPSPQPRVPARPTTMASVAPPPSAPVVAQPVPVSQPAPVLIPVTPATNSKASTATASVPTTPIPTATVLSAPAPAASPSVSSPAPESVRAAADAADAAPAVPARIASPAKPTSDGSRSLIRSLGLKLSRVVIDAGHGGHDTGTIGPSGYTEKEVVLDVAMRLKDLIENDLGAEVVMTRSKDVFVPLETRTAVANQQKADLFISIHANSSKQKTVRGVETFFLNITRSREVLDIAARENATSGGLIHDLDDIVKKIMMNDKIDESRDLAQHVQKSLAALKGSGPDRGVKEAPFVVLIGANMPSVLAEIGFISNPSDEKQVKTPAWRQQIAESLFEGVRSYSDTLSGLKTAKTQDKTQE